MLDFIRMPEKPSGTPEENFNKIYSYLYNLAMTLNKDFEEIGGSELTDGEQAIMKEILRDPTFVEGDSHQSETLKQMIVKTAAHIKTAIEQYNISLKGSVDAEGALGRYVRKTGMDVAINPEGIRQQFTFEEIISGLQDYKINSENYIHSGLLRTVGGMPIYGVAVGRDVTTFEANGAERYRDANKVGEFTADGVAFYKDKDKIAEFTADGIVFYSGRHKLAEFNGDAMIFYNNGQKVAQYDDSGIHMLKWMELVSAEGISIGSGGSGIDITEGMLYMNTSGMVVLHGNSESIINLSDGKGEVFSADILRGFRATNGYIASAWIPLARIDNLSVGNIDIDNNPFPNIVFSATRPTGVSNTIWLEPQTSGGGGTAFSGSKAIDAVAQHACTRNGNDFRYEANLASTINLEGVSKISLSGKVKRNGAEQTHTFTVSAKVKCDDGSVVNLGQVGSGTLFGDYTLTATDISYNGKAKKAKSVIYTLTIDNDEMADYSSFYAGTLSYSGTTPTQATTDLCNVHYIE